MEADATPLRMLPERWEHIIKHVEAHGGASVEELSRTLGISEATVRRDLARIEGRGLIERTWGGATPLKNVSTWPTIAQSRRLHPTEKTWIGQAAARLIKDRDCLILDGGYTVYQVARHIQASDISVVTNSIDVVQALLPRHDAHVVLVGGELDRTSGTAVGQIGEQQLRGFRVEKAFLGADAVSPEAGLCAPIPLTAQTKRAMIASSSELIVVADHSKLGKFALYQVAPAEAISILVTDSGADRELLDRFRDVGIEVIVTSGPRGSAGD